MRILLYGVGALGSLMAHFLCKAGNDVTIVARSTYDELCKNGLIVEHYLKRKTTIDYPKIVKKAENNIKYDIVFSVMQSQQQESVLETLSCLNTDLVVLVGNNMEADKCEQYILEHAVSPRRVVFGFQNSMGHREGGKAVTGGLPVTDTVFGGLHAPANPEDINKIKKALKVSGYRVTEVEDMYAYYMYHVAEIVPYCLMCYKVNYNLKSLKNRDIKRIIQATKECFDYLKSVNIKVMPKGEDGFYEKGIKGFGMYILYMIMAKTYLGQMCIADHSKNGIDELVYLYNKFDEFRMEHPGNSMPTWDGMRKYLPQLKG